MFLQPDWWEVMQAGVGTNRYNYSFGGPVNGIDPSGHISVWDAFKLSKHAYEPTRKTPTGFEKVSASGLKSLGLSDAKFSDKRSGLDATLYRNTRDGEYTLAFAGTTGSLIGPDWRNNATQPVGFSKAYRQAAKLAGQVSRAVSKVDGDLSFVGHSQGGGEAAMSVIHMSNPEHREAVTFNAAGVGWPNHALAAVGTNWFNDWSVDNYYVVLDPLSIFNDVFFVPNALGEQHALGVLYSSLNPIHYHSIEAVEEGLLYAGIFGDE
jgi:hypothetical protein